MHFTPKLSSSGLTWISPIEWYPGVTGATFHENLTNYNSSKHDLYTFNYGYDATLYKSLQDGGAAATARGGTYYYASGWNENNYLIKEFGKTPFTAFSFTTAYFFQYGPAYQYNEFVYQSGAGTPYYQSIRNIAPIELSPGVPGIGPRWTLLTKDVAMTMGHFQGTNPSPDTTIQFIGNDNIIRGYTLAKRPNGSTAAFTQYRDYLICKLSQPVHDSIKPVVFLEKITDPNLEYLNQLAIYNLPYLTINRCRNIGYKDKRYLGHYAASPNMNQYFGYYGFVDGGGTAYNFGFVEDTENTSNSYISNFDANYIVELDKQFKTQTFISFYSIIKQNTDLPSGYFDNFKYKNMLTSFPINNGDSTAQQFLIFKNNNEYRSVLVSVYGDLTSEENLYSAFGTYLETTLLPRINPRYNTVEKINKQIINKSIDLNNISLDRAFDVDSSILFFAAPKSLDETTLTINAVQLTRPNAATTYGLPPLHYPNVSDIANAGFTTSAIANTDEFVVSSYGFNAPKRIIADSLKNEYEKIKINVESQFSFKNQKILELEQNKKYLVQFNANLFNNYAIQNNGITLIKYDNYADWFAFVLLGLFPPGISHNIQYRNVKLWQNILNPNFYFSQKNDSFASQYLITDSIKVLQKTQKFPFNINNISTINDLNEIFEYNYTNNSQLVGLTQGGYPLLYPDTYPQDSFNSPIISSFSIEYDVKIDNLNKFTLYLIDTDNLPEVIYLHAVDKSNTTILGTMQINIVKNKNINVKNLLASTNVSLSATSDYYELSNIEEIHMEYLGVPLPSNISPAGITYQWNKIINDYTPVNLISNTDYNIVIDNQIKTTKQVIVSPPSGICLGSVTIIA
jgi:hypothetical protein